MKGVRSKAKELIFRKVRRGIWLSCLIASAAVLGLLTTRNVTPMPQAGVVTTPVTRSIVNQATEVKLLETYGKLPLQFEANQGQTDSQVKFLSRGNGYNLFLTSTEAVLSLTRMGNSEVGARDEKSVVSLSKSRAQKSATANPQSTVLRMKLVGANPQSQVVGLEELPGKVNYFIGNDLKKWRTNIPTYTKVKYKNVYSGVDLVYYGNHRQLEYDFIVAPGADPKTVRWTFDGAEKLEVNYQGDLVVFIAGEQIRLRKPFVYQEVNGARHEISGGYVLKDKHQVGFQVAAYDASKPLLIDPVLVYSTYLGGSGSEFSSDIAVDAFGNAYVTGNTSSTNFPTTVGPFQAALGGGADAFVAKLNAAGNSLIYSTYLGGSGDENFFPDFSAGIAVDIDGNAYVTGHTNSTNFPTTAGAFQTTFGGGNFDAFVVKLNSTGSALVYSTYLGGGSSGGGLCCGASDVVVDITVETEETNPNAYMVGFTDADDFPTTAGAFQPVPGGG